MIDKKRRYQLLRRERDQLRRMHRKALRLAEKGYRRDAIAQRMGITVDDVWELLSEIPC